MSSCRHHLHSMLIWDVINIFGTSSFTIILYWFVFCWKQVSQCMIFPTFRSLYLLITKSMILFNYFSEKWQTVGITYRYRPSRHKRGLDITSAIDVTFINSKEVPFVGITATVSWVDCWLLYFVCICSLGQRFAIFM